MRTLLIVEDNAIERAIVHNLLKEEYNLVEVSTGEDAIKLLSERSRIFSAVVLDLMMPGIDGFEVLKKVKNNALLMTIPIIVVTSLDDDRSYERAIACGADGLVTKPVHRSLLLHMLRNAIKLRETAALVTATVKDKLTRIFNREAFINEATRMIFRADANKYILTCFNIENFKIINQQYGADIGDSVLKHVAKTIEDFVTRCDGICGRYGADKFVLLFPEDYLESEMCTYSYDIACNPKYISTRLRIRIGRCRIKDKSTSVSALIDRALIAESSIRGRYDTNICEYSDKMYLQMLKEQQIVSSMDKALENNEFHVWYQPQFNHATGAIVGAEALVRWIKDGVIVPPADFISIFEFNGFIYKLDQFVWEQVCIFLRDKLDNDLKPVPISVNISRRDLLHRHIVQVLTELLEKYKIPRDYFRLEITESAFTGSQEKEIVDKVNELVKLGFSVEIDDFGSGYSSLNILKDVNADILKLDMRFFEDTENYEKSGNIISSVVRMAKWLGMSIVAEGVENVEQADYLKSLGCNFIQGYYYAKPMPVEDFLSLHDYVKKENKSTILSTVINMNNNKFWDPKSMDSLLFNSYVGSACIYEYCKGKIEMLRVTDSFVKMFNSPELSVENILKLHWEEYIPKEIYKKVVEIVKESQSNEETVIYEIIFENLPGCQPIIYLKSFVKVIAKVEDRYLLYCINENVTDQRIAEIKMLEAQQKQLESSEHLNVIMNNISNGVSVGTFNDGVVNYLFNNDKFFDLIGYTREQFENECPQGLLNCIHPDDMEYALSQHKMLTKDITITGEFRIIRRDKKVVWLHVDGKICKYKDEYANLAVYHDITREKVATLREKDASKRISAILKNINGGVSALQFDDNWNTKFIYSSEKYYELYGYTQKEIEDNNIDVLSLILPEDLDAVKQKVIELRKTKMPTVIDYRIRKKDGSLALIRTNSSLLNLDEHGEVISSVLVDISEVKLLKDQLTAITSNTFCGITAFKLEGDKEINLFSNKKFYQILGYKDKEEFDEKCKNANNIIHPDDRQKFNEFLSNFDSKKPQNIIDFRIIRPNGEVRYLKSNANEIKLFGIDHSIYLTMIIDKTDEMAEVR